MNKYIRYPVWVSITLIILLIMVACSAKISESEDFDPHEIYYSSQVFPFDMPECSVDSIIELDNKIAIIYYRWYQQNKCEYTIITRTDGGKDWNSMELSLVLFAV